MKNLKNEFILDGKVQKDVKVFDTMISFNVASITGKVQTIENRYRNRFTFIRVLYVNNIDDKIKEIISEGNYIRIYGKLDSEQYIDKNGKTVYNKILNANRVVLLQEVDGKMEEVE